MDIVVLCGIWVGLGGLHRFGNRRWVCIPGIKPIQQNFH